MIVCGAVFSRLAYDQIDRTVIVLCREAVETYAARPV